MFYIKLSEKELALLNSIIVELPYKVAAPLVENINSQIKQQQAEKVPSGMYGMDSGCGFSYGDAPSENASAIKEQSN